MPVINVAMVVKHALGQLSAIPLVVYRIKTRAINIAMDAVITDALVRVILNVNSVMS